MKIEYKSLSLQELKANDEKPGTFTGRASVYGIVDSSGDVVMPGAFTKSLQENGNRIKVLAQHNPSDVIGLATLEDKSDALWISEGSLVLELPSGKDMHTRIKNNLIDGLSIGYEVMAGGAVFNKQGIRELHAVKLWEVSLVTWPMNAYSRVTDVKNERDIEFIIWAHAEIKAGRVLSAVNETRIRTAHTALMEVIDQLDTEKNAKLQSEQEIERLALLQTASETLGKLLTQ